MAYTPIIVLWAISTAVVKMFSEHFSNVRPLLIFACQMR